MSARPKRGRAAAAGGAAGRRRLGSDERTVTPLYHQMYLVLRQRLRDGQCDPAVPLPGEHQLASQFGVSRVTVRRTLRQLELEGLVSRRRGVGTFPAARPADLQHRYNIGGMTDPQVGARGEPEITTLDVATVPPPAHVAALLGAGLAEVLRIDRHRAVRGAEPFTLMTAWIPPAHAARLSRRQLRAEQILVALEEQGVDIARAEQTVTARAADEVAAARLRVPVGTPLIAMVTLFADRHDEPVALLESLYRPDRYEYRLTMLRQGGPGRRWQLVD